jgi:hypothetical protein
MSLDPQARLREERAVSDANALKLPLDQQLRWSECRSSHRFLAFSGKQIVVYRLSNSHPQITDQLVCKGLDVGLDTGLSSLWESQESGTQFWVSATPKEVAPSCFFWMLKHSTLDFVEFKGTKSLKFSMAYRTEKNPSAKVDGTFYLLEKPVFDHFDFGG